MSCSYMLAHRLREVLVSSRPQLPSASLFALLQARPACDWKDVDELRLKEPGEDGAEDPGVVFAVADDVARPERAEVVALVGLQ